MPVNEVSAAPLAAHEPIASTAHFVGFLLLISGMAAGGFLAQHHAAGASAAPAGQLAAHTSAIPVYLVALFMDWALFYYCWSGVHHRGGTLSTLTGGRWRSAKALFTDVALAIPVWGAFEGIAYGVHYLLERVSNDQAKVVDSLLPRSFAEVTLWILLCVTAGFCEEIAFRGYLQKQFHARTRSIVAAVLLQGLVFGVAHGYQGWKNVVVISGIGILYGSVAAWRRNLRATMITHAWSDLWEGWIKILIFR
jgi:membrane protease YdiL (CAAX protease family)